jgi:hypothetical protein
MKKSANFKIQKMGPSFEAFGALVDFLSRRPPFAGYEFGAFCRALRAQVLRGQHVCAIGDSGLVGYCGWLPTTQPIAEAWLRGEGKLTSPPKSQEADAVALTVVAADENGAVLPLIRASRNLNPNRRVYFKRSYPDRLGANRKSSVLNQVVEQELIGA